MCSQVRYRSYRLVHHQLLWSPAQLSDRRARNPENLSSVIQKEFCNTIPSTADLSAVSVQFGSGPGAAIVATVEEGHSLSEQANPLRSVHANRTSGATSQIKRNPARKWTAVINHYSNRPPVLRIRHRYPRSERQRAMRSRIPAGFECLTTRRPPPCGIERRDYMLPRTNSVRSGVREEPSEAPTVSLRGRRD